MRRRSSVEGVDTAQEAQGCQAGEAPEQYSMKKALSGERAGAASSTVQGGPSSTTPVLLSCVDSFDTAPSPHELCRLLRHCSFSS